MVFVFVGLLLPGLFVVCMQPVEAARRMALERLQQQLQSKQKRKLKSKIRELDSESQQDAEQNAK